MFCSEPTADTYFHQESIFNRYAFVMEVLMMILIFAGMIFLFYAHRNLVKPFFIKVLWAIFCLINMARLSRSLVVYIYNNKRDSIDDPDE